MYMTQTDIMNMNLKAGRTLTRPEIVKDLVDENERGQQRAEMLAARDYFSVRNTKILSRQMKYYIDGIEHTADGGQIRHSGWEDDKIASNNKLLHAFHRSLTLQKVGYAFKNKPIITGESEEIDAVLDAMGFLSDAFHNTLVKWAVGASNKGFEWLHPFPMRNEKRLKWVVVNAENCIPVWDSHYYEKLEGMIRYYPMTLVNNMRQETLVNKVEWWDSNQVTYYIEDEQGHYHFDATEPINPRPHFMWQNTAVGQDNPGGWGRVPFIQLKNNIDMVSDFRLVQHLIEAYDFSRSDLQNTLQDLQDALIAISGSQGENAAELRKNIKTHKIALLGEDQKAETLTVDVPRDAREYHDKQLKEDIYENGMGVHFGADKWGNNPSGITLKFMFAPLDIKVDLLYAEAKQSLKEAIWFGFEFDKMINRRSSAYDPDSVNVQFSKNVMVNEAERVDSLQKLTGIISRETQLENLPFFVNDVEAELERIAAEKEKAQQEFDRRMEQAQGANEPDEDENE